MQRLTPGSQTFLHLWVIPTQEFREIFIEYISSRCYNRATSTTFMQFTRVPLNDRGGMARSKASASWLFNYKLLLGSTLLRDGRSEYSRQSAGRLFCCKHLCLFKPRLCQNTYESQICRIACWSHFPHASLRCHDHVAVWIEQHYHCTLQHGSSRDCKHRSANNEDSHTFIDADAGSQSDPDSSTAGSLKWRSGTGWSG